MSKEINVEKYLDKEIGIVTPIGNVKGKCTSLDLVNGFIELNETDIYNLRQVVNIRVIGTELVTPPKNIVIPGGN